MPRKSNKSATTRNGGDMLSAVARLSEAERRLTQVLDKTSRYLPNSTDPLLLPTPQSMEEVTTVLAVARTYADRTSAPSGWNPNVPIFGFVTPNPLPHQLRGGQLAALQLQQAQEERERKRKAVREEQEEKKNKQIKTEKMDRKRRAAADQDGDVKMEDASAEAAASTADPKRRELDVMHEREDKVGEEDKVPQTEEEATLKERQRQVQREREARQKAVAAAAAASATSRRREVPATMNLSESSSSEEEESDDESEQ